MSFNRPLIDAEIKVSLGITRVYTDYNEQRGGLLLSVSCVTVCLTQYDV